MKLPLFLICEKVYRNSTDLLFIVISHMVKLQILLVILVTMKQFSRLFQVYIQLCHLFIDPNHMVLMLTYPALFHQLEHPTQHQNITVGTAHPSPFLSINSALASNTVTQGTSMSESTYLSMISFWGNRWYSSKIFNRETQTKT